METNTADHIRLAAEHAALCLDADRARAALGAEPGESLEAAAARVAGERETMRIDRDRARAEYMALAEQFMRYKETHAVAHIRADVRSRALDAAQRWARAWKASASDWRHIALRKDKAE